MQHRLTKTLTADPVVTAKDVKRKEASIKQVCGMYSREAEEAKQESKRAKEHLKQTVKQFDLDKAEILRKAAQEQVELREALKAERLK